MSDIATAPAEPTAPEPAEPTAPAAPAPVRVNLSGIADTMADLVTVHGEGKARTSELATWQAAVAPLIAARDNDGVTVYDRMIAEFELKIALATSLDEFHTEHPAASIIEHLAAQLDSALSRLRQMTVESMADHPAIMFDGLRFVYKTAPTEPAPTEPAPAPTATRSRSVVSADGAVPRDLVQAYSEGYRTLHCTYKGVAHTAHIYADGKIGSGDDEFKTINSWVKTFNSGSVNVYLSVTASKDGKTLVKFA